MSITIDRHSGGGPDPVVEDDGSSGQRNGRPESENGAVDVSAFDQITDRAGNLLDYAAYEATHAPETLLSFVKGIRRFTDPELIKEITEAEERAKRALDAEYENAGFVSDTLTFRRRVDGVKYPMPVEYRIGKVHPEKCLVLTPGLVAGGKESMAPILGSSLVDGPDDITVIVFDRAGFDREAAPYFHHDYDPLTYYMEQVYAREEQDMFALELGAKELTKYAQSLSGSQEQSHMDLWQLWEHPALRKAYGGSVLEASPASTDLLHESRPGHIPGIKQLVSALALVARRYPVGEGKWTSESKDALPDKTRPLTKLFTPKQVATVLTTLPVAEFAVGADTPMLDACKWRLKKVPWQTHVFDLHSARSIPERSAYDALQGLNHLIFAPRRDRLVPSDAGMKIGRRLGLHNCAVLPVDTGHYPLAEATGLVTYGTHRFTLDREGFVEAYKAHRKQRRQAA